MHHLAYVIYILTLVCSRSIDCKSRNGYSMIVHTRTLHPASTPPDSVLQTSSCPFASSAVRTDPDAVDASLVAVYESCHGSSWCDLVNGSIRSEWRGV